jgi:hypothetical protein
VQQEQQKQGDVIAQRKAVRWVDVRALRPGATEPAFLALMTTVAMLIASGVAVRAGLARLDSYRMMSANIGRASLDPSLVHRADAVDRWTLYLPLIGVGLLVLIGLWMLQTYTNLAVRRWGNIGLGVSWIGPLSTGAFVWVVANFGFDAVQDGVSSAWRDFLAAKQIWVSGALMIMVLAVVYMQVSFSSIERKDSNPLAALRWLPGVNVFLPKRSVDEVWSYVIGRPPILVDLWWTVGLLSAYGQMIPTPRPENIGDLTVARWTTVAQMATDGCVIVFAVLTLFVVWRCTLAQGLMITARRDAQMAHLGDHRRLGHR